MKQTIPMTKPTIGSHLLTVEDVANLLSCSVRSVYRMKDNGSLPKPIRLGGTGGMIRWRLADIEQHIANALDTGAQT